MKRIAAIILAMMLLLSGCDDLKEAVQGFSNEISGVTNMTEEEIYKEIDRLMGYPDGMGTTDLVGEFTFVAVITSDVEELEFEDEEPGMYCSAEISREYDDYFLLDVTGVETQPTAGDIVKITGIINGSIYWTEDNKMVEVLSIRATALELYEPTAVEVAGGATIEIDGNTIEFLGAHKTTDSFGEAIVVYFKFTNNSEKDATPTFTDFYIEYNGHEADSTIFSLAEVEGSALSLWGAGITPATYPGKTLTYYVAFEGDETAAVDEPIYFSRYNDEFQMTYDYGMYIAASLAELTGEVAAE